MPPKLLRPLLTVEFLIAIQAVFTFWSQVGGQYHLDLMYWPWKFGVSVTAALLITGITAALVRSEGAVTRRVAVLATLLLATIALAGCLSYFYHLNEPDDQDDSGDTQPTISRMTGSYQTRQELARTIG
jgi:heme/copper-type cytochrome/quinol oxidase subunit 4